MSVYLSADLRERLLAADDHQCAYCQTSAFNSGQPMTVEHINPRAQGGETVFKNLCFACRRCNEFKSDAINAIDPLTGNSTELFNPRQDVWKEHFQWDVTGIRLLGQTGKGRATIVALKMNNEVILAARRRWAGAGWHPPS